MAIRDDELSVPLRDCRIRCCSDGATWVAMARAWAREVSITVTSITAEPVGRSTVSRFSTSLGESPVPLLAAMSPSTTLLVVSASTVRTSASVSADPLGSCTTRVTVEE